MRDETENRGRTLWIIWVTVLGLTSFNLLLVGSGLQGRRCFHGCAKTMAAAAKASTIDAALSLHLLDRGLPGPPAGFRLGTLLLPPGEGGGPSGPYLERPGDLLDPWGNPFVLVVSGRVNASFDVVSYGVDGKPGGSGDDADITQ